MIKVIKKLFFIIAVIIALFVAQATQVFAANDEPLTVINNLSDFIFGLIRAVGLIILGFGVVQIGMSLKSQDPSQRANGFLTLAGRSCNNFCQRDFRNYYRWLV